MRHRVLLRTAILPVLAACSCSALNTRPGHPDSWNTVYYTKELLPLAWKTRNPSQATAAAALATPVFKTANTPTEIWQARGYAFNLHLRYQAASYKAQNVQDELAIPLFGAAIATVATGLAKASTVAVAATGLGGASLGAGESYLHPDKDAATNQAASSALLCVVDQSKMLNDMSAIPLVLDKAALQDALSAMRQDVGISLIGTPSSSQAKAAQAVETAAEASIKALNAAISAYVALPGELYLAADTIDQNAQLTGARTTDYSSILKSLQTSASNQTATDKAKSDLQNASDATASTTQPKTAAAPSATMMSVTSANLTNALKALLPEPKSDAAGTPPEQATTASFSADPSTGPAAAAIEAVNQKVAALHILLNSPGSLTRVNLLAKAALDDIPEPNFSAIAATVKNCTAPK